MGPKLVGWGGQGRGKVVAVAQLTPPGVGSVVKNGWTFRREVWARNFADGEVMYGRNWSRAWADDTSDKNYQRLIPQNDKIYDRDAPSVNQIALSKRSYEVALNFRQWVEWHGEQCSEYGHWHFQGRWKLGERPEITYLEVGNGWKEPPSKPFYPP